MDGRKDRIIGGRIEESIGRRIFGKIIWSKKISERI